jgi:hypothetical protein
MRRGTGGAPTLCGQLLRGEVGLQLAEDARHVVEFGYRNEPVGRGC